MSNSTRGQYDFIRCRHCGAILTGSVRNDGTIVPVGVGKSGKCGEGEFEVIEADLTVGDGQR